jgi:hypothetical protein
MKYTSLLLPLLFVACTQKLDVPANVVHAFVTTHPGVSATWEKEGANFEASFTKNGKLLSCVLDKDGVTVEEETAIALEQLPAAAQQYLQQHFPDQRIKALAKIEKTGQPLQYEAEIDHKDYLFDEQGTYIGIEKD